jgi:hypothetical protein
MPLQNRVTPFGEIVAVPARGLLTGNRGIIHDPGTRTLLKKRWALKAWICCRLHYKDQHRVPMAARSWTELFFLDEATALAAGHRPCFYCRRGDAEAFRAAWARGHGGQPPTASLMDHTLHDQRLADGRKALHPLLARPSDLPDGAMLAAQGKPFMMARGRPLRWTFDGYRAAATEIRFDGLLTPPAIVATLGAGYRPLLHPSAVA